MTISVSLDGTLAQTGTNGSIGEPCWKLVRFLEYQLALGNTVEIFTNRPAYDVQEWLDTVAGLPPLEVTTVLNPAAVFYSASARQVLPGGVIVEAESAVVPNHQTPPARLLNTGLGRRGGRR